MSRLLSNLGSGTQSDIETDIFTRMLTNQIFDTEEIRKDWTSQYEYVGIAALGSDTSLPLWNCVRCTWTNGHKTRIQFRSKVVWDNRYIGWN